MPETRIPEALALLRERGWCKGFGHHEVTGQYCIRGALREAWRIQAGIEPRLQEDHEPFFADVAVVAKVIRDQNKVSSIVVFNDDPATTFADVERVLEKAALERGGAL